MAATGVYVNLMVLLIPTTLIYKYCSTYFKLVELLFVVRFTNFHTPAVSMTHPARVNMNSTQPIPSPASKPVDEVDDAAN